MFIHTHHYRHFRCSEAELRLIYDAETPERDLDTPPLLNSDERNRRIERLRNNPQYDEADRMMREFSGLVNTNRFDPEFAFLRTPQYGEFHRSVINTLILLESKSNLPSTAAGVTDRLGVPSLQSFLAINSETFTNTLGATVAESHARVGELGLEEAAVHETYKILVNDQLKAKGVAEIDSPFQPGGLAPKATVTANFTEEQQVNMYNEAVFRVWLQSFTGDLAENTAPDGTQPSVMAMFRNAELGDTNNRRYAAMEITLRRYKKVISEIYIAFGDVPDGMRIFHEVLPEQDRLRLIRDYWYGNPAELKRQVALFGDESLRGRLAGNLLVALRDSLKGKEGQPVQPHPLEWMTKKKEACTYLLSVLDEARWQSIGMQHVYNALTLYTNNTPPAPGSNEARLVDSTLEFLAGAVPVNGALGGAVLSAPPAAPLGAGHVGNLDKMYEVHEVVEATKSDVELIKQYIPTLNDHDIALLSVAYQNAQLPFENSAENWRTNPNAAFDFLRGLPHGPGAEGALGRKIRFSQFYKQLEALVNREPTITLEDGTVVPVNEGEILNALDALGEDLVARETIMRNSGEERRSISAIQGIGNFFNDATESFNDLWRRNPVAAGVLSIVLIKAGYAILFGKKRYQHWIRNIGLASVAGLWVVEKYNPFGLKDAMDNRLRNGREGESWDGTLENYYAGVLKDPQGKEVIAENDDKRHRALSYIARTPTGELLDFYQQVKSIHQGRQGLSTQRDPYTGISVPSELNRLRRQSTYNMSRSEMIDIYVPILESFFAHYSQVRGGGPAGGLGPRRATAGYDSRVADGYEKIRHDIVEAKLLIAGVEHERGQMLRSFIMLRRNEAKYAHLPLRDRVRQAQIDAEANPDAIDADLVSLSGVYEGGSLYEAAMGCAEGRFTGCSGSSPDMQQHLSRHLKQVDECACAYREEDMNLGPQVPFEVVMRMILDPQQVESYVLDQDSGYNRYLYETNRGNSWGDFFNYTFGRYGSNDEPRRDLPPRTAPGSPQNPPQVPPGNPQIPPQVPPGNPQIPPQVPPANPQNPPQVPPGNPQIPPQVPPANPQNPPQVPPANPQNPPQVPPANP